MLKASTSCLLSPEFIHLFNTWVESLLSAKSGISMRAGWRAANKTAVEYVLKGYRRNQHKVPWELLRGLLTQSGWEGGRGKRLRENEFYSEKWKC